MHHVKRFTYKKAYRKIIRAPLTTFCIFTFIICSSSCSQSPLSHNNKQNSSAQSLLNQATPSTITYSANIDADGINSGKDIYTIITDVLGKDAIEAPDLYQTDHTQAKHIYEAHDEEVGEHFVLSLHRDLDGNKGVFKGRQRNEFKVYGHTNNQLKGFENSTFEYAWKMKINQNMQVSKHFTHFFQLKPKGGDDGSPTFTITGAKRRGKDVIEIRYQVPDKKKQVLATVDWAKIKGQWLNIYLKAKFADKGHLTFSINQLVDNKPLIALDIPVIDLWIGHSNQHYQRPKWGIVRSLKDSNNLREDEDTVSFAQLMINRL